MRGETREIELVANSISGFLRFRDRVDPSTSSQNSSGGPGSAL